MIYINKVAGQTVGQLIQLSVGHLAVAEDNGSGIWDCSRLSTEQAHQRIVMVEVKLLATTKFNQPGFGILCYQRQLADGLIGHGGHVPDNGLESFGNLSNLLFTVERCIVNEGQN